MKSELDHTFPVFTCPISHYTALVPPPLPAQTKWTEAGHKSLREIRTQRWNIEDIISFVLKHKAEYPWLVDWKWNVWNMDFYGSPTPRRFPYFKYSKDMK